MSDAGPTTPSVPDVIKIARALRTALSQAVARSVDVRLRAQETGARAKETRDAASRVRIETGRNRS